MPAQTIQFEVDFSQVEDHSLFLAKWPEETEKKIGARLKELFIQAIALMQRGIIPTLPRGATGLLKQSYAGIEVTGEGIDIQAFFGSTAAHAPYVEEGTRPHFPPSKDLILWVIRKLGIREGAEQVAFLVARAIAGQGKKGQKGGTRAQRQVANWLGENEQRLLDGIIRGLDIIWEEAIAA